MNKKRVLLITITIFIILCLSVGAFGSKNFFEEKFFLTLENKTIIKMTEEGTSLTDIEAYDFCTDDSSKMLFTLTRAFSYSSGEFKLVCTYDSLKGYIFAGFGKLASVHNNTDDVDFYDYEGKFIKNIKFKEVSDKHLQYISGIFLDDNTFLLSEDGNRNIVKINISEESCEIFKAFDIGWLGEITKFEDFYYMYVSSGASIYKFSDSTDPICVGKDFPFHITGLEVEGDMLYFVSNFGKGFYKYNIANNSLIKLFELNSPDRLYTITYNK
ncbi:MAG: hypothetical protein R6U52_00760 [Kosmotogaceae bacterium]